MIVAKKSVFTSEALAVLDKKAGILKTAKDTTNPFANWKGPIGKYYARLRLISGKASKKPGAIDLIFVHTCLARLPDSSSATAVPDEQYAGETMRIWTSTAASKKQTEEQAWERTMQTIQAYDIKTAKFGMRDGSYNHSQAVADLAAALDYLNEKCPAVLIEVTAGTSSTFLDVQGIVDEKAVARFGHVQTEITDDMVGEIPADEDNDSDSGVGVDELPDEDALRKAAEEFGTESLLEMLQQAASSGEIPLPENLDFSKLTREIIIEIGVSAQMQRPLPDLSAFLKQGTASTSPASSSIPPTTAAADDDDEASPASSIPDDDEEEETAEDPQAKALMALQLAVAAEDRTALKKRLRNMGALRPEDKFTTDQTDEFLRQWCIDVFTGAKPRLVAVAPSEVPFQA